MFEERKKSLLFDQKTVEEKWRIYFATKASSPDRIANSSNWPGTLGWPPEGIPRRKREMVNIFTSNRLVDGKRLISSHRFRFRTS